MNEYTKWEPRLLQQAVRLRDTIDGTSEDPAMIGNALALVVLDGTSKDTVILGFICRSALIVSPECNAGELVHLFLWHKGD